jgi:hypothetical protein
MCSSSSIGVWCDEMDLSAVKEQSQHGRSFEYFSISSKAIFEI